MTMPSVRLEFVLPGEARRSVANRKSYDLGRDDEGDFEHWDMQLEFLNMLRSMMR